MAQSDREAVEVEDDVPSSQEEAEDDMNIKFASAEDIDFRQKNKRMMPGGGRRRSPNYDPQKLDLINGPAGLDEGSMSNGLSSSSCNSSQSPENSSQSSSSSSDESGQDFKPELKEAKPAKPPKPAKRRGSKKGGEKVTKDYKLLVLKA